MQEVNSIAVWGLNLAPLTQAAAVEAIADLASVRGSPRLVVTANANYAMLTARDPGLQRLNERAAFLLADGMPLVWAAQGRLPERVTGADLVPALCAELGRREKRVAFVGARPENALRAAEILKRASPGLSIVAMECGEVFGDDRDRELIERLALTRPDVLFAALGQPKGERWLDANRDRLGAAVLIQVGAAIDFIASPHRRAPRWMRAMGLEWMYRALHEPRRLIPRYTANAVFALRRLGKRAA